MVKQGQIHGISHFPSLFLPVKKKSITDEPIDRWTDGRTHPLYKSWLTTKNDELDLVKIMI